MTETENNMTETTKKIPSSINYVDGVYKYGAEYKRLKNKEYYEKNREKILKYHREHVNNKSKK